MKYQELQNVIKEPFFDTASMQVAASAIPPSGAQLIGWQRKGWIRKMRRGLYVFTERAGSVDPFVLSSALYHPSYVSLESALRHYNLIPEMVPNVTAVTGRTTRTFHTGQGTFFYRHMRPELFFGYTPITASGGVYLLADAEKALLDFVYFHTRSLRTPDDVQALRLNPFEFASVISTQKLVEYLRAYDSPAMERAITLIRNHVNT